jgi:protein-disulfide isomerase
MASRAEQKAAARAAREAAHKELNAAQARRMRLIWLGGLAAAAALAIVIVVVAAGGGGGSKSTNSKTATATVAALLKGIPQSGNTLGNPKAAVTVTEFGDLVCPVCQDFALTSEAELISKDVRAGKVKLVYRGLETASSTANPGEYVASQVAARAAGLQGREWDYVLLWYHEQGDWARLQRDAVDHYHWPYGPGDLDRRRRPLLDDRVRDPAGQLSSEL